MPVAEEQDTLTAWLADRERRLARLPDEILLDDLALTLAERRILPSAHPLGAAGSRRLRIGFDLDGVFYDFRASLSRYLISIGRTECTIDAAGDHWDFFEAWGMNVAEFLEAYRAGVDAGVVLRLGDPLPGSVEATRVLAAAGHSIHIVTDRSVGTEPGISARHTAAWLAEHGYVFDSLTISADKTAVATDHFIDDRYENYVARVSAGQNCHLLTRPWNIDLGDAAVNRVTSIEDFVAEILSTHTADAVA